MDKIFELGLPGSHDNQLRSLRDLCGEDFEAVRDIAVVRRGEESPLAGVPSGGLAYRNLGPIGPEVYSNWQFVLDQQVTRWITAIAYRRENPALLRSLSPALHDLSLRLDDFQPDLADVPFMRTVRMLVLLEALLLPEIRFAPLEPGDDAECDARDWRGWRGRVHAKARSLLRQSKPLAGLIRSLSTEEVAIEETDWSISIPLLMLVAVVYSQYEYYASVFWPAHSALRARDELQRSWETALKRIPVLQRCCDLVALLIRHQSVVGKFVRQSGDGRFAAVAARFAAVPDCPFSQSTVLDALGLMSILEEARLRRLPGTCQDTPIGPCRLNAGTIQPWEPDERAARDWFLLERQDLKRVGSSVRGSLGECLASVLGRVFRNRTTLCQTLERCLGSAGLSNADKSQLIADLVGKGRQTATHSIRRIATACRAPRKGAAERGRLAHTWTYTSRLAVDDDDVAVFRQFVEQHSRSLPGDDPPECAADIAVFSFGLTQSRDLQPLLEQCVTEVAQAIRRAAPGKAQEAGRAAFGKYFRLSYTQIPCVGIVPAQDSQGEQGAQGGQVEHVVEIQLREELAAWGLLLPGDGRPEVARAGARPARPRPAADVLARLFDKAVARLAPVNRSLYGERYVPFPLMQRMLEVVARLRPTESLSVAVEFDGRRRRLIRFPAGLDRERHEHLVKCIAGCVHAVVLNEAMSQGFHSCDVSFDGLEEPPGRKRRSGKRMTPDGWKEVIRDAYRRNCYGVLADKYVRDYNTERRSVELLDVARPTTLRKPSPDQVPAELERWIEANPLRASEDRRQGRSARKGTVPSSLRENRGSPPADQLLLGIDVGATLTKIQFYSVGRGGLLPVGDAYQIGTPRVAGPMRRRAEDASSRFAAELAHSVEQISRADGALRSRFEGRGATLICVGVAWPGPVRANHVAGTSGILEHFPPLTRDITTNRIEAILDLDVAGAVCRGFAQSHYLTQGREPFVALLNDGDAAGHGTLVLDGKLPGRRLAVVKIGTGTATTVLDDGQQLPGACEGGKVILDLGATPAHECDRGYEYPTGVANVYLSKRLMPETARRIVEEKKLNFRVDTFGSREIGLLLLDDPRPLRDQCGLRALAEEKSISIEILRRVLEKKDKAEIDLQHQVEGALNAAGFKAIEALQRLVEERGLTRLAQVLQLQTDDVRHFFHAIGDPAPGPIKAGSLDPQSAEVKTRMDRLRDDVVKPSVRALGEYLGDFLVLYATQYGADAFVVAGGVLRKKTGELVREAAIERAARYGFQLRSSGSLLEVLGRPPWMAEAFSSEKRETDTSEDDDTSGARAELDASHPGGEPSRTHADPDPDPDPGYGTAGAAVFSAGEFLLREKQKGLEELRSRILRLPTNACATLSEGKVSFDERAADEVRLAEHALSTQEVKEFLARQRMVVQTETAAGATRYTRIVAERSQAFETHH